MGIGVGIVGFDFNRLCKVSTEAYLSNLGIDKYNGDNDKLESFSEGPNTYFCLLLKGY